jgi:hypothetical protein
MQYAAELGLGQFDLSKIDIRGEKPESVKKTFKLHTNVNFQLDSSSTVCDRRSLQLVDSAWRRCLRRENVVARHNSDMAMFAVVLWLSVCE